MAREWLASDSCVACVWLVCGFCVAFVWRVARAAGFFHFCKIAFCVLFPVLPMPITSLGRCITYLIPRRPGPFSIVSLDILLYVRLGGI